jgi:DNA-damage-inducible protein D
MKTEVILSMVETFEAHAQQTDNGIEYWLARDLQQLLGYEDWRNFVAVIAKAKTACELSGHSPLDHFVDVNKMVPIGSGVQREIDDLMLTRYACYLIAQNGDPQKQQIAFAQTYFAMQTRKAELIEQRLLEAELSAAGFEPRINANRRELSGRVSMRQTRCRVSAFTDLPVCIL